MSYQPATYRAVGGNEIVIESTGLITVKNGGEVNVDSGGRITLDDGAHFALPVTTQSTTSGTITNFGLTLIGTTIADGYTLADPTRAGLLKAIFCTVHGATTVVSTVTTASTNVTIGATSDGTTGIRRTMNFTNAGQAVVLVSSSTTAWVVVANVNTVGFAT